MEKYPQRNAQIIALSEAGVPNRKIVQQLGVNKNIVAGVLYAYRNREEKSAVPVSTTSERLDALHRHMDKVLAAARASQTGPPVCAE